MDYWPQTVKMIILWILCVFNQKLCLASYIKPIPVCLLKSQKPLLTFKENSGLNNMNVKMKTTYISNKTGPKVIFKNITLGSRHI